MKTDEGYELIRQLIDSRAQQDPKIRSVQELIADGSADFKDTSEYSRRSSEILGTSLSEHILELDDEAREDVCKKLLHDGYEDINDVLAEVQTSLDEKTGVNIRPKKPPFQTERVATFAHSLADHTVADYVIKRRAKNGAANISMSDHDRYMKENAKLRHNAGLKCYIERDTDGSCCEWCSKMAGSYVYGEEPKDVYRRHDNCGCSVTYKNGKQRQNVWSKKTWEADKDERISKTAGKEPTVFGKAEAQAKQSEILARKELTYGEKSGIINIEIDELTPCLRDNKTGELVQTEVRKVTDRSELLGCTEKKGWNFPWSKAPRDAEIYALRVKGSTTIEGLIALKKEPENAAVYLYWGNAAPHNRITEANTQKKFNGVGGHLFAIAADISVKEGYGGFIYADAANKDLYELFVNEYGATPIPTHNNPYRFFFDGEATRKILNTYTFDRR